MPRLGQKIKSQKSKESLHHPEAKGLFFIGLSVLLFLCLLSFVDGHHELNWLGFIGHLFAFLFQYIFGLGSYFILGFMLWLGWGLLKVRKYKAFHIKLLYFLLFVSSTCLLLSLFAETKWIDLSSFYDKVYSQEAIIHAPMPVRYVRYNTGGVPFYYLYRDLPNFNFQNLLGDVGVLLTFSILWVVSFILLTDLSFLIGVKRFLKIIPLTYDLTIFFLRKILQLSRGELGKIVIEPKKMEESFAYPKYHEPPYTKAKKQKEEKEIFSRRVHEEPFEAVEEDVIEEEIEPEVLIPKAPLALPMKESAKNRLAVEEFLEKRKNKELSKKNYHYDPPPMSFLTDAKKVDQTGLKKTLKERAQILEETLISFGIEAKVGHISCGPTITSFEVHPAIGVKVQKIKALENDIALNMQAKSIRIIAPIPGKAAVGVEIPSLYPQEVGFKEMLSNYRRLETKFHIPMLLGKTVSGEDVICDLTKMPHCIIAGATGSGKSVCINTIIMSIIMNMSPEEIRLILIDPKKVELTPFTKLPHLISPVITEPTGAYAALNWIVREMEYRYELLKRIGLRNVLAFNRREADKVFEESLDMPVPEKLHYIVCIIDEFADLMMTTSTDLETPIARIAQMARAVGIHMILATQRPSREVITGLIKANFPTRISFKVSSRINSQIILDENGAESLLGNGDMLFLPPGTSQLVRCQGVFIRDEDINKIIDDITRRIPTNYLFESFDNMASENLSSADTDDASDPLYQKAQQTVIDHQTASTTFLQRKLKIGYARAASLIDELEQNGVIGPQDGSKPRKIFKSLPPQ
jgi:S-DNA-T family DNA segregation ATPase FtsK/SpoIIIE